MSVMAADSLELMTFNLHDALSRDGAARGVVNFVVAARPDVAIFPEAYKDEEEGGTFLLDHVADDFDRAGYDFVHGPYARGDWRAIGGIVRRERLVTPPRLVDIAGRQAVWAEVEVGDEATAVAGPHLDDRYPDTRLAQGRALLALGPDAIAGDLNDAYPDDPRARMIGRFGWLAKILPRPERDPLKPQPTWRRYATVPARLDGMSQGQTMTEIRQAGYDDADPDYPKCQPTIALGGRPTLAIDHIVARSSLAIDMASYSVQYTDFSDHAAVSATLRRAPVGEPA